MDIHFLNKLLKCKHCIIYSALVCYKSRWTQTHVCFLHTSLLLQYTTKWDINKNWIVSLCSFVVFLLNHLKFQSYIIVWKFGIYIWPQRVLQHFQSLEVFCHSFSGDIWEYDVTYYSTSNNPTISQTEYNTHVLINSGCIIPSLLVYYTASSGTRCVITHKITVLSNFTAEGWNHTCHPHSDIGCDVTNQVVL